MRGVALVVVLAFAVSAWLGAIFLVRLAAGVVRIADGSVVIQSNNEGALP